MKETFFSTAILSKILSNFDLGRFEGAKPVEASGNIAYEIRAGSKKYFLRLSPSGERSRSRDEILAEIALLKYLKRHDFPVVVPIPARDGHEIISWRAHHGYLRPFVAAKEKMKPSLAEVRTFGATLGRFHRLVEGARPVRRRPHIFDPKTTRLHFLEHRNDMLKSGMAEAEKFVERWEREMAALKFSARLPKGLIHEDLGKRHALWRGNKIAAIIDFDRTYYAPLVLDLGQCLRGWCFVDDWRQFSVRRCAALLSGYRREHRLTRQEGECLVDAVKFALLERALAFVLRYVFGAHRPADRDFALDTLLRQLPLIEKKRKTILSCLS
jgi:homoserine kinase type II